MYLLARPLYETFGQSAAGAPYHELNPDDLIPALPHLVTEVNTLQLEDLDLGSRCSLDSVIQCK